MFVDFVIEYGVSRFFISFLGSQDKGCFSMEDSFNNNVL